MQTQTHPLEIEHASSFTVHTRTLRELLAAAAEGGRLHFFVGFGALFDPEDIAPYEAPSDVDDWDPWSDHYPERLRRRGFVTLDALYPAPGRRAE